jgi:hypothetical protein
MTIDVTADPGETIRSDGRIQKSAPLPTLSVDLRKPPSVGANPGADLEIRGVIGEGGMGRVLLARQHSLSRDVAVKTVKHDATDSARAAILTEGAITGQLEHPAIVPVHALGLDTAGWPALVMKRIEGTSWQELVENPAHAGWEGWEGDATMRMPGHLQILESVCNALHFAHSRGIVHRDIKPANVLIGAYGDVYLADWGVAGEVGSTANGICGTPAFLAPEMVTGGTIDARTDVYLLGSTLHLILTGQHRHPGATVTESLEHARISPAFPYPAEINPELAALANQACDSDPAKRPPTARAFRDALKLTLKHRQAVALGEQAEARLREYESLNAGQAEHDVKQREKMERLLAEARFGLEQSLAQWSENAAARTALTRAETILDDRRRATLALEAESRERDPRHGNAWRTGGLAGMSALTFGVVIYAYVLEGVPSPEKILFLPTLLSVIICLGAWSGRNSFLATRFNRQAFACVLAALGLVLFGRLLGLRYPIPLSEQFTRDSFIFATASAITAIGYLRWLWILAVAFTVSGVLCTVYPEVAVVVISWSTFLGLFVGTLVSWREGRRSLPS